MDYQKIFELYEKLYFHEVEAREKISARLQIPLAIILSFVSVYAIFIKGISFSLITGWHYLFFFVTCISIFLFVVNCMYFIKAFYGHAYEFLPSAKDTEEYRQKLIETYKEYDDCDSLVSKYFSEYLFRYYNECSSINTKANDKRSDAIHKSNTFSILNVIPLVLAFIMFACSGIDNNSRDREYKVNIVNPLKFEEEKHDQSTEAANSTTPSTAFTSSEESSERRREDIKQTTTAQTIEEENHVKRRSETSTTTTASSPTNKIGER